MATLSSDIAAARGDVVAAACSDAVAAGTCGDVVAAACSDAVAAGTCGDVVAAACGDATAITATVGATRLPSVVTSCAAVGGAGRKEEFVHTLGTGVTVHIPSSVREWQLVGTGCLSAQLFAGGWLRRWWAKFCAVVLQPSLCVTLDAQFVEHLLRCRDDLSVGF
ncbi:hypothetical protein [Mycolicibacter icosiumassiliensis]|uniref:hypothetical protein n=1 Tax=Mycolicibacter icosiumassiliensis TaxID=1792835 RepID=UPI0012B68E47|nr:hypothetical protein [Mycolicibacter icosiumassiliensis]